MSKKITRTRPDGTVEEFIIGKGDPEPGAIPLRVEVGRSTREIELQTEVDQLKETTRLIEKERDEYRDELTSKAIAEAQKMKDKARELGAPDELLEGMDTSEGLSAIKAYINKQTRAPERGATDPPRGSLISLEQPGLGQPNVDVFNKEYDSYGEMVTDLHNRAEKGDKRAREAYDRLWQKLANEMKRTKEGITFGLSISQCPYCSGPVQNGVCLSCGQKVDWQEAA